MKTNSEIRQEALAFMKGNWGVAVGVSLVFMLLVYACSLVATTIEMLVGTPIGDDEGVLIPIFSMLASILLIFPLSYSFIMLFLSFQRGADDLKVKGLFKAFNKSYYSKSMGLYLLIAIFTALWTMLLIVPGIIKSLSYALAPYILADNPEISANEAINRSMEMMKGHKMDLFLMWLGYMGFASLSILALGIPLLWLYPYYQVVIAKFYEEIKNEYNA
jgi:uncharacterized membrane protein